MLARKHSSGGYVHLDGPSLPDLDPYDLVWVDIETSDQAQVTSIFAELGFDPIAPDSTERDYFHAIDERTHSTRIMLGVPQVSTGQRLAIDPIHVVIGDRILITDHDDPVPAIDRIWDASALDSHGAASPATLAAVLAQSAGREMIPLVQELETRIDALEDLALASDPRTLTESHTLRRDLITLRRLAGRQRDTLEDLSESVHPTIGQSGRSAFARSAEQSKRIVETLDSARNLLTSSLETYRGAVADQTNEIVRLLTVFSAILLPLGLIAGLFGMNFLDIPGGDDRWGFWITVGAMLVIAIGLWLYFAKQGFVGAPKLRDIPKAVGLGIVQVGTAPVRALASGVESTVKHLDFRRKSDG